MRGGKQWEDERKVPSEADTLSSWLVCVCINRYCEFGEEGEPREKRDVVLVVGLRLRAKVEERP